MATPTARSILLASPPGQFDLILEDIQSIAPKSLSEDVIDVSALRAQWAATTGHAIVGISAADDTTDESNGCIDALRKAMDDYVNLKFTSPGVRAAHRVKQEDGGETITITTYAERIDLANHSVGSWNACYAVKPSLGHISGSVSITAHTFENGGNVQLHSNMSLDETSAECITSTSNDNADKQLIWAKSIVKQVQAWEDKEVMDKLADMYERMNNEYLKSLRRVMPITRTKMDWNVMAHRVRITLGEGHDKDKLKHQH
uniref:F-actin-capping protein subunit alpha n=1 Tax=Skeletonema marinoi TaxID=267567 RepID=A0A7S2PVZ7_9STRA|mmetsp:Transcript_34006/g.57452  ORF Transcript_34006/g.57452 Transcript_34006/m.57452 type:complete len:259 (+) Transcript_34006:59-835(+)